MTSTEIRFNAVERLRKTAADFETLATFVHDNADLCGHAVTGSSLDLVHLSASKAADPVVFIAEMARRGAAAGARLEEFAHQTYAGVNIGFGAVALSVYGEREVVCEDVTVGTKPDVRSRLKVALDGVLASTSTEVSA